jgi:alkaline phosphatase D
MKLKTLTLGLCVAAIVVAHSGQSRAGLVAYWSFDTDFTADDGGTAFDLMAVNGATAGDAGGQFGNAASFQRANSEYAFTSGNVLAPGADFSYSAWYNLGIENIEGSARYFVLETTAADTPSATEAWTASIGLRDIGGDVVEVFTTSPSLAVGNTPATLGSWQNVTVTFDADGGTNAGTGIMRAYLDGSSTPFATADNLGPRAAVEGLVIGGHRAGTGRNFDGQIDAVSFYDHVLTASQISNLQSTAVIPEPSSAILIASGVALALGWRNRKRS